MSYEIEAVYTKGAFVPTGPLPLIEGAQVHLRIDEQLSSRGSEQRNAQPSRAELDEFLRLAAELPIESPDDGFSVEDHDKVIYRLP
jgi:predicted DNA-binding antitoxin AbrB/MazE fold protein